MKHKIKSKLGKRQLALIDDLFAADMDEARVLAKHRVKPSLYRRWLEDTAFANELRFRLQSARRQSEIIIAKYSSVAAAKLVELTESDKEETARKACLDIIAIPVAEKSKKQGKKADGQPEPLPDGLCPELAAKLLDVMANEDKT